MSTTKADADRFIATQVPAPAPASAGVDDVELAYRRWIRNGHAGELCTHGPVTERKPIWIVKFEDADRGESHFHSEDEAIEYYLKVSDSWNCTLLTTVRVPDVAKAACAPAPASAGVDDAVLRCAPPEVMQSSIMDGWQRDIASLTAERDALLAHTAALEQRVRELEAKLRKPTKEMLAAGERAWMNRDLGDPESEPIRDCYLAMIEAALAPPPAQGGC
jgi:hypothetical protein